MSAASSVLERLRNNSNKKKLQFTYVPPPPSSNNDDNNNNAQDCHIQELMELLPHNHTITHVVLERRFVHALSPRNYHCLLRQAVGVMPALMVLELWNVHAVPLRLLCQAVQSNACLQELRMGFVGLHDLQDCAPFIQQHASLAKVSISEFRLISKDENEKKRSDAAVATAATADTEQQQQQQDDDDDDAAPPQSLHNLDSFLIGLSQCPQLQSLELFSNRRTVDASDDDDPWSPQATGHLIHSSYSRRRTSLHTLTLRRLHLLTVAHITAMANALQDAAEEEYSSSLRSVFLDVSENEMGDDAAIALAQSIVATATATATSPQQQHHHHHATTLLRSLNLRENSITATGCRGIVDALLLRNNGNGSNNNNNNDNDGDNDATDATTLHDSSTQTARITTTITRRTGVLEKLNLSYNNIGDAGARALAELLLPQQQQQQQYHPTLQHLELTMAKIHDDGCIALAHALQENTTLLSLGLAYNRMTTASYLAFARALQTNRTLQSIHLQANRTHIGLEGCQALVDMLQDNYVLETLSTLLADAPDTERKGCKKRIGTYLRLNNAGRKHLLLEHPTKLDWVNALIKCQDDFNALYYLIKAQPSICEVKR